MSISLLNPEFQKPYFQPDPNKEYAIANYDISKGFTYLMALVMSGSSRLDEFNDYIRSKSDDPLFVNEVNKQNEKGLTALMMASRNSRTDSSEHMVEQLIPMSNHNLQDRGGNTALMLASIVSRTFSTERTVELLIPKSDDNLQSNNGWTALMMASMNSQYYSTERTVELLIPTSDHNLRDKFGRTALMWALSDDHDHHYRSAKRTIELLIPKSNLYLKDNHGYTALMFALAKSTEDTIELLLCGMNDKTHNTINILGDSLENLQGSDSNLLNKLLLKFINGQNKVIIELNNRLSERETFKQCLKDGTSLPEAMIISYM